MKIRIQEHGNWPNLTNKPGFGLFEKAFLPLRNVIWPNTYFKFFHVKINFLWRQSGSRSAWICSGFAPPRIRSWIVKQCGYTTLPVRTVSRACKYFAPRNIGFRCGLKTLKSLVSSFVCFQCILSQVPRSFPLLVSPLPPPQKKTASFILSNSFFSYFFWHCLPFFIHQFLPKSFSFPFWRCFRWLWLPLMVFWS